MVKRKDETFSMVAKTLKGLEALLAGELNDLKAGEVKILNRAVSFTGTYETLYRANYYCRTALKVLVPIASTRARNTEQLYQFIRSISWNDYFDTKKTFAIESVVSSTLFTHSLYVSQRAKDAVADYFREKTGRRPSVNPEQPDIPIHIHISNDEVTVLLDSSGESLHKRGYRVEQGPAPLNEVLAAGLIMLTGWKGNTNFFDPMCGSGTLPIEAAMIAYNIPPGSYRKAFAFERWPDFNIDLYDKVVSDYNERKEIPFTIAGSDISPKAFATAGRNIKNAYLTRRVGLLRSSVDDMSPPSGGGVAIINPPYGERLKPLEIEALYKRIGDALKKKYVGYEAWIFTANKDALKHLGLKTSQRLSLYNGPLECKYYRYNMFSGGLADRKANNGESDTVRQE